MYLGGDVLSDNSWALASYQTGEPRFYVEHLRVAVELVAADAGATLVLSGAPTRAEAGPVGEAESYRRAGEAMGWFGHTTVSERCILEECARDSFENLQFGIARFQQHFSQLPSHVTITGWRFKRERFDLHRIAIGWPLDRFTYCGVDDPADLPSALAGERRAVESYRKDPLGIGQELQAKREQRNPFGRQHGYTLGTIAVAARDGGPQCSKDFLI